MVQWLARDDRTLNCVRFSGVALSVPHSLGGPPGLPLPAGPLLLVDLVNRREFTAEQVEYACDQLVLPGTFDVHQAQLVGLSACGLVGQSSQHVEVESLGAEVPQEAREDLGQHRLEYLWVVGLDRVVGPRLLLIGGQFCEVVEARARVADDLSLGDVRFAALGLASGCLAHFD